MKHTTDSVLPYGTWNTSGYTQVFSGTVTNGLGAGWKTITLSTPFAYNNSDNLQIAIQHGYQLHTILPPNWQYNVCATPMNRVGQLNSGFPNGLYSSSGRPNIQIVIQSNIPTVNAGIDKTICYGANVSIGGNPTASGGSGAGFTYGWSPATGLSSTTIANPVASPTSTTIYTVTVNDVNGCSGTDNVTVTVNPLPNANAGNDVAICNGASTQLNASGGTSYSWSPAAGLSATNISNPVASPATTTAYVVTVTNSYGCTATDNVIVTVNPLPMAEAGNDTTILAGDSIQIGSSPISGYSYSWTPITSLDNSNIANPLAFPIDTTVYKLTVTDNNGCSKVDSITLNTIKKIIPCYTDELLKRELELDTSLARKMEVQEELMRHYIDSILPYKSLENNQYIVPVVIHIVHSAGEAIGSGANISDAQILNQIDELNNNYSNVLGTGFPATDISIKFCLATKRPDGTVFNGITRTSSISTNLNLAFGNAEADLKQIEYFPSANYLNIWVITSIADATHPAGQILGFAHFPNTVSSTRDGIVIVADRFGDATTCAGCNSPYQETQLIS